MPNLSHNLIGLGANLLTLWAARRLKRTREDPTVQTKVLRTLLAHLARTDFGREHQLTAGLSPTEFTHRVAPREYRDFLPQLERMQGGASDVLWPGRCRFFASTAGTTTGRRKLLPVTDAMLRHLRHATRETLLHYTARAGHAGVMRGRHVLLTGCTRLHTLRETEEAPIYTGNLAGIAALNLPAWAERHFHEPGTAIAEMGDWGAKLKRMVERIPRADVSLLAGMPPWLMELSDLLVVDARKRDQPGDQLDEIWPNLECLIHYGQSLAPHHDELRRRAGSRVEFHEVYAATEACIAVQDADARQGLRLLTNVGVYYEFIPLEHYQARDLAASGRQAVPVTGLESGRDYVILLTTPAGLVRYVLGDIVRCVTATPPRLLPVGRLPAHGGEPLLRGLWERELSEALVNLCRANDWPLVEFHVNPLVGDNRDPSHRPAHEWWIELKPGTVRTPIGPAIARTLDDTLQSSSPAYRTARSERRLGAPVVRLVMPGTFRRWMEHHHCWGAPHRVDHVRGDRRIADDLAQIAPFHTG
jgi:hypothetical protein